MAFGPRDFGISLGDMDTKTEAISSAIGFYLYWFALVEMAVTLLLANVLGFDKEYERIELLVYGLDASGKVTRLIKAGDRYQKPAGPWLQLALKRFSQDERRLRNVMAHSWPVLDDSGTIHFSSLGAMPEGVFGPAPTRPLGLAPTAHSVKDIYGRALWLKSLYRELISIGRIVSSLSDLEVDPSIVDPLWDRPQKEDPIPRTKIDKRVQKAHRKRLRKPPSEST